jgi:hypothetical protein
MALSHCRECGQEVSTKAETCSPARWPPAVHQPSERKSSHFLRTALALVGLFWLGMAIYSVEAVEAPAPHVQYTADALFAAYDTNEVATDIYLKVKIVDVTGRIQSIDKDFWNDMIVSLQTRNEFMPAKMHVISSQEAQVAALRKGQIVLFSCTKMKRWVGAPWGSDCVLLGGAFAAQSEPGSSSPAHGPGRVACDTQWSNEHHGASQGYQEFLRNCMNGK